MSPIVVVVLAKAWVLTMWECTVVLHIGYLRWTRASSAVGSAVVMALLAAGGIAGLWIGLAWAPGSLRASAVCLYLAGCLGYLELRSLLSRGYSLRILVDVFRGGGPVSCEELAVLYGNGLGLSGLLRRRLSTLARLHLVAFDGLHAGPLTPVGRAVEMVASGMRRALRTELVG